MQYLRLLLIDRKNMSGITRLDVDLSGSQHLILGSNGSGKSNFLRELSGLPPDANLYGPNGQKSIWYKLDNGDVIEFTSYPNQRKPHQVYLNDNRDVNLNVSGTQTEQRELVKRYTGVTQVYFDLFILGKISFSETKPSLRRMLFDDMSNASYDYAMAVYTRVKDGHKEHQAVVKHLTKRLVELNNQKLDEHDIARLEQELEQTDKELADWFELRKRDTRDVETIKSEMSVIARENRGRVNNLLRWFEKLEDDLDTPAKVKEKIAGVQGEVKSIREQISTLDIELTKLKRGLRYDSKSKEALTVQMTQIDEVLSTLEDGEYTEYLSQIDQLPNLDDFTESVSQLQSSLQMLTDDEADQFDKVRYDELLLQMKELKGQDSRIDKEIAEYQAAIDHEAAHASEDGVTCPNCGTYHFPFKGSVSVDSLKDALGVAYELKSGLESNLAALEPILMAAEAYLAERKHVATLIKAIPLVAKWWLHHNLSLTQPTKASRALTVLVRDVGVRHQYIDCHTRRSHVQRQLDLHSDMDATREAEYRQRVTDVDAELNTAHARLAHALDVIRIYIEYGKTLSKRLQDAKELEDSHVALERLHHELQESLAADIVNAHLSHLNKKRSEIFNAVNAARNNAENILQVTRELRKEEETTLDHLTLMKALSPVDGVIAEGMLGFIQHFVDEMNYSISKLWVDPLTITPCLLSDSGVELDYLFPVRTLHESPEDVSVCSSGQKEIIDLAFREAGMQCLQLSTHPILFDEWGVRMDNVHKQRTAVLLGSLTEQTSHDQIVMVSHQNVVHDSFTDIMRLVLCDKNIDIDGEYNTHVYIER